MGNLKYLIIVLLIFLPGFLVQLLIPACHCAMESCSGCGEIFNGLAHFSNNSLALAMMGLVLFLWFGIPILILYGVIKFLASLFSPKSNNNDEKTD